MLHLLHLLYASYFYLLSTHMFSMQSIFLFFHFGLE